MDAQAGQYLDAARGGDIAAAADLIGLFYERLYGFLRRLSGSEADAADLTQRAFARIWQALPTYAGRAPLSAWMHGIAYHTFVDWRRADPRLDWRPDVWWEACAAPGLSPADAACASDSAAAVYAEVERLEPETRATVHLHYYQGLTLEETAQALEVATSTVKYRLRQAIGRLQSGLRDATSPGAPAALPSAQRTEL